MMATTASNFINAVALWALLALLPIAALLYIFERSRLRAMSLLVTANSAIGISLSRLILPLFVISLLICAIARPFSGLTEVQVPRVGRDLMLVVDVSKSMLTKDVAPSRLEFAKRKIMDLLSLLRQKSPGDRVGLVLFSGDAYLFAPLTSDYSVLGHFVKVVDTELVTSQGSSLQSAIEIAVDSLNRAQAKEADILLISDGEDNRFDLTALSTMITKSAYRLHILGLGTTEGRPIETKSGAFLKDQSGNIVISKLLEEKLIALADNAGGIYLRASATNYDIERLLREFSRSSLSKSDNQVTTERIYNEFGHYLSWVVLAIIAVLLSFGRGSLVFSLTLLIAISATSSSAAESEPSPAMTPNQAYHAYLEGEYDKALPVFEKLLETEPNNPRALQALGSIYYKLGRFGEAERLFSKLAENAQSGRDKFAAHYNRGNSLLMKRNYSEAIADYDRALAIKPGDNNTLYNRELAKKLLQQQKEEQKKQQEEGKQQSENNQQSSKSPEDSQSESKSSQSSSEEKNSGEESEDNQESTDDAPQNPTPSDETRKESGGKQHKQHESDNSAQNPEEGDSTQSNEKQSSGSETMSESMSHSETEASDSSPLQQSEARAWLESLPDQPIQYRRNPSGRIKSSGQTW